MSVETKKQRVSRILKYSKDLAPIFFQYCQQGLTLTQIAEKMSVDKQKFIHWSKDPTKYEWQAAWIRGRQACQAFHEELLDEMIRNGKQYDAASKQLQKMRMERMFDDWKERPTETKAQIEHTHIQQTPEKMKEEITRLLSKAAIRDQINVRTLQLNDQSKQPEGPAPGKATAGETKEGSSGRTTH